MTAASRPSPVRVSTLRRAVVTALAIGVVAALAGCTTTAPGSGSTTRSAGANAGSSTGGQAGGSGSGQSSPSATPTGGAGVLRSTPFTIACGTLVPAATVNATYSGMVALATPDAPKKSDAAVIGSYGGTVCTWKNPAGTTMTIAVGKFGAASLTKLKNSLVTSSNQVPTYDGEGYFDLDGTTGTAEAFTGDYWIVATSSDAAFSEPGGAEPLVDAAITTLKKN